MVLGIIEKSDLPLPTVPVLGKAGSAALLAYLYARSSGSATAHAFALGMASVAAYQLAKEGQISGF